ncbi:HNH endonuclease [Rhodoferax sp.]|uniref:HNH endonuclease n=1 Tax=Rhodoferax sp. TaxID=50421 RepID=UPI0025DAB2C8|nr:HNH endonuclease [Rhodoferax sp.]MCM2339802.1 HNH endonuclease [Rhodoferax sp.]
MKRLPRPILTASQVYDACISGVKDVTILARYKAASKAFEAASLVYEAHASAHSLYQFPACAWGKGEQVILDSLTKADLGELYESYMVNKRYPGRSYYDQLLASAPLGKCPYCGFGQATTVDHFLAKARYPAFSVMPNNLVPACSDCNKGKGSVIVLKDTEASHPYFEDARIEKDAWLFATIAESKPVTATYAFVAPLDWPSDLSLRVKSYFGEFDLADRFAIEAASEMVSVSDYLTALPTQRLRTAHLNLIAQMERGQRTNGWKAALYEALSRSDWYCASGYIHS